VGGRNGVDTLNDVEIFFPSRDGVSETPWEYLGYLPSAVENFDMASILDRIYLIKGKSGELDTNETAIIYQLTDDTSWQGAVLENEMSIMNPILIPLGSMLYIITLDNEGEMIDFWRYQAYFYEIYFPIVK
jgi:hypothetical protein